MAGAFDEKYELLSELGKGGMGVVYKAMQKSLNRVVAVKKLSDELNNNEEFVTRFRNEALIIAKLDHPNIIRVYDIEEFDGAFHIIMEFVPGQSLQERLEQVGALNEKLITDYSCQIAKALHYAHFHGIIHRDIKPDNVMLTSENQVKVMDFGISCIAGKDDIAEQESLGTPNFMSPEQVKGERVDGRSDIYSLGIVIYAMSTGSLPFWGTDAREVAMQHITKIAEHPKKFNPDLHDNIVDVILKCMEKNPEKRFGNGESLATQLEGFSRAKEFEDFFSLCMGDDSSSETNSKETKIDSNVATASGTVVINENDDEKPENNGPISPGSTTVI